MSATTAMSGLAVTLLLGVLAFASDDPHLEASGVVSAADHRSGSVSPGEVVVLYVANAGPEGLMGGQLDEKGRVATVLEGTRVLFDGLPAPVAYTVRGEVGAVVPYEVAGRTSTNIVVEYQGRRSAPVSIPVVASNPSLFTENRIGTGEAGILNDTGCCNSPANPAVRGSWATVYATGEGLLRGHVATGSVSAYKSPSDYPRPELPVRLTVGGLPAELGFVAAAPYSVAGVLQINFRVPLNAPAGDAIPLALTVGRATSSAMVTMAIRSIKDQVLVAISGTRARTSLAAALASAGYQVHSARDKDEAVELVRGQPLDLVVFDLQGSEEDRRACIVALRAQHPRLKVILAVDSLGPETLASADMLDAQAVLATPIAAQVLLTRVRDLMRRRPAIYDSGPGWPFPGRSR